jgi:hypothetical protein
MTMLYAARSRESDTRTAVRRFMLRTWGGGKEEAGERGGGAWEIKKMPGFGRGRLQWG